MAIVLSCRRCLQSRSLDSIDRAQPLFCPFCHLELDWPDELPARPHSATGTRRVPRRWPLFALLLALLVMPVAIIGLIAAKARWPAPDTEAQHSVEKAAIPASIASPGESKPAIVVSGAVESNVTIVARGSKPPQLPPAPAIVRHYSTETPEPVAETRKVQGAPPPKPTRWPLLPTLSEEELKGTLIHVPEIDLDSKDPKERKNANDLLEAAKKDKENRHPLLALARTRDDLRGLPFRGEDECQLEKKAAKQIGHGSVVAREAMNSVQAVSYQHGSYGGIIYSYDEHARQNWRKEVPATVSSQILQGETSAWRHVLVWLMAGDSSPEATAIVAQRAVFDLDASVRETAIQELMKRQADDYLPVLLASFRHPWWPAANHAAEALVALNATSAIPNLVDVLDQHDPRSPLSKSNERPQRMVRELVRVNHLRNCMLCHAPIPDAANRLRGQPELVPGAIPTAGEEIPRSSRIYYALSKSGFVRADVTYLKQDFSVMHKVENPGKWPAEQRYDYLVRTRPATWWERIMPPRSDYPQRRAVLAALRALTGLDPGDSSGAWREALGLD